MASDDAKQDQAGCIVIRKPSLIESDIAAAERKIAASKAQIKILRRLLKLSKEVHGDE
jgi:hypothetical protein